MFLVPLRRSCNQSCADLAVAYRSTSQNRRSVRCHAVKQSLCRQFASLAFLQEHDVGAPAYELLAGHGVVGPSDFRFNYATRYVRTVLSSGLPALAPPFWIILEEATPLLCASSAALCSLSSRRGG